MKGLILPIKRLRKSLCLKCRQVVGDKSRIGRKLDKGTTASDEKAVRRKERLRQKC
jgi:hypothetical protein